MEMATQPLDLEDIGNIITNSDFGSFLKSDPQFIFSQNTDIVDASELPYSSSITISQCESDDLNQITEKLFDSSYQDPEEDSFDEIMRNVIRDSKEIISEEQNNEILTFFKEFYLESIDQSISERSMSVLVQPPKNIRRRYQSDGKRQIEKSRSAPVKIKLPNLKNCKLQENDSFWLQLVLITCERNPLENDYIHVDKLEYHADDIFQHENGFVRIPLTENDIQIGLKQLGRISIIKTKLDNYKFELTQFNPSSKNNQITIYERDDAQTVVSQAKRLRDQLNLNSSRIAFQLLIKQDDLWHSTDIVCKTDPMVEKEKSNNQTKRSNKQSPCSDTDDDDEHKPLSRKSNSGKRLKNK